MTDIARFWLMIWMNESSSRHFIVVDFPQYSIGGYTMITFIGYYLAYFVRNCKSMIIANITDALSTHEKKNTARRSFKRTYWSEGANKQTKDDGEKKSLLKKTKNVDVRINLILAFYDSIRLECVRSSNKHMQTCKVLPRGTMHRDKKKEEENNTQKHQKLKKATQHTYTTNKSATKEIQRQTDTF